MPDEDHLVPFGIAEIRREGEDVTVVATSDMVSLALQAAESLASRRVYAEVIDPRTLEPLDIEAIGESIRKTGRLVAVDEDTDRCGVGAEIGAQVMEQAFEASRRP